MGLARKMFLERETYDPTLPTHPRHGKMMEGYSFYPLSHDVVQALKESGVDLNELSMRMLKETASNAEDIDWDSADVVETWDQLPVFIMRQIIRLEMPLKFPDLIEENERRIDIQEVDVEEG